MVKTIDTMKKLHQLMGKTTSQHQNGGIKFKHKNIKYKGKWAKYPKQKTQTGNLDKKSKPISVLYSENPSHVQEHTQAQNKGMEDLSSKWRAKKEKAGVVILVSDKIDFKTTKIKRDKAHYIMVKG